MWLKALLLTSSCGRRGRKLVSRMDWIWRIGSPILSAYGMKEEWRDLHMVLSLRKGSIDSASLDLPLTQYLPTMV